MNNSIFEVIYGQPVDVLIDDDQLTLSAKNGWVVAIYSKFSVLSEDGKEVSPSRIDGMTLIASLVEAEKITFLFDSGYAIEIYLTDDAFNGPEALQLAGPNNEIIVW
jgi:hypothetical protein